MNKRARDLSGYTASLTAVAALAVYSFFIDPLSSVYFTILLFALIGFAGFYLLAKEAFGIGQDVTTTKCRIDNQEFCLRFVIF